MRKSRVVWVGIAFVGALVLASAVTISRADSGSPSPCTDARTVASPDCPPDVGVYGVEMRAIAAQMAAHPHPELTPIPVDEKMLYQRAYRRVVKETDVYDAPGGNVVGHIDAGFTFVNAGKVVDGWVQIRPAQWLPQDALGPVNKAVSKFSGVAMPDGMPTQAFGWILLDTKPSKTPGAKPTPGTLSVKRYTLVNLFATERVGDWEWYLIGPDQWIVQTRLARLLPVKRPDSVSGKWFAVNLYEQTLIAYDGDKAVFATLISSGLDKWPTDEGVFKIYERYEQVKMSGASGQPDFYYLPQVPWVMYFNQHEQALHGAYWHDGFGYRHSHGCVNMSMTDAQWAFTWTKDQPQAWVYVYSSGEYKHATTS
jgi:L,D-transpeptidase-like protein